MKEMSENLLGVHFSRMLAARSNLSEGDKEQFRRLVTTLFGFLADGHSCMALREEEEELLKKSELVSSDDTTPLIIHNGRLYLHRYYTYEKKLAEQLVALAARKTKKTEHREILGLIFADQNGGEDLQRKAGEFALNKMVTILSGGPGTGKTTTVVRIIAALFEAFGTSTSIGLAAPTGKAAMRLHQSIQQAIATLDVPQEIAEAIPTTAQTLHRLLGVRKNSPKFRHDRDNPLKYDVVIVDEASMVDLSLMSKLIDALHPEARIILLGDKDQLASVESGAVLAELTDSLPENTVVLTKSYRFNAPIKELAEAIRDDAPKRAWELIEKSDNYSVQHCGDELETLIKKGYEGYMYYIQSVESIGEADVFGEFNRFRILCGVRGGRRGVESVNELVEQHLMAEYGYAERWYPGKPIMISRNDYNLGLFNGDIGICFEDREDSTIKVWFEREDGTLRAFLPYRLPEYSTAYALTIHKSQGSEFADVVVILPEEDSVILSRELIYTAVTRARERVWIAAGKEIFHSAVSRKTFRFSGLSDMIRELRKTTDIL